MTTQGQWAKRDEALTLDRLEDLQDPSQPNYLNDGKPFSEGYAKVNDVRKQSLVHPKLPCLGEALFDSQVVVVVAATGTGKTLQIPQYCLHQLLALDIKKRVDVVQPSRISAYACGERLRLELDGKHKVDYMLGQSGDMPEDKDDAKIFVATDKLYVEVLWGNTDIPASKSAIIILDEVHLLSLNVELLLGALHLQLKERPELRLLVTSATCDADRLVKHFEDFSPIKIEIAGSPHLIKHIYLQPDDRRSQETRILQGLRSFFHDPLILNGDCIVFMKNEAEATEMSDTCSRLLKQDNATIFKNVEFLTLSEDDPFGEYQTAVTSRAVDDGSGMMKRKVIFATGLVASSITIPGIRLVMITGRTQGAYFHSQLRATEMLTQPLSKSEIMQMCRRAGRTRSGTVMHFYHCKDSDKLA